MTEKVFKRDLVLRTEIPEDDECSATLEAAIKHFIQKKETDVDTPMGRLAPDTEMKRPDRYPNTFVVALAEKRAITQSPPPLRSSAAINAPASIPINVRFGQPDMLQPLFDLPSNQFPLTLRLAFEILLLADRHIVTLQSVLCSNQRGSGAQEDYSIL